MQLLLNLISGFIPTASAAALQTVGASNAGVSSMWSVICNTLPFCGLGASTAPQYFATKIIAIVMSLITSVAIIMIIYASIQISMNQMDDGKLAEGKKIIIYALAGIILSLVGGTFLSYLLLTVFPQLFNG